MTDTNNAKIVAGAAAPAGDGLAPILGSIAEVGSRYAVWLVDLWGVMHNGIAPYPGAVEACRSYRATGGRVVFVSNAPRPSSAVVVQLRTLGVPDDAYDGIVTSGDVTRGLIEAMRDRRIHHIGASRDRPLFEGLGISFATSIEADVVVVTNLIDDQTETPDDYRTTLSGFRRRGALMVCANPDIRVERGDRIVWCAGALAEIYAADGGDVIWAGKPHPPIYELALGLASGLVGRPLDNCEVLAVGDGLLTDMKGAAAIGIDAAFIASGISVEPGRQLDSALVSRLFDGIGIVPVIAMDRLAW